MDLNKLMEMAGQLQQKLQTAQSEAANITATGESGGGLVKVVLNGKYEVLEVKIDPKAVVASEVALLEDLVRAATNQAGSEIHKELQTKLGGVAQGLGIDPSQFMGGGGGGE